MDPVLEVAIGVKEWELVCAMWPHFVVALGTEEPMKVHTDVMNRPSIEGNHTPPTGPPPMVPVPAAALSTVVSTEKVIAELQSAQTLGHVSGKLMMRGTIVATLMSSPLRFVVPLGGARGATDSHYICHAELSVHNISSSQWQFC